MIFGLDDQIKNLGESVACSREAIVTQMVDTGIERIINDRILNSDSIAELNASNQHRRLFINNGYLRFCYV